MTDVWGTDDDQVHENLAPGGIDDETDKETGGTVGNETIKTTGNSTITTIDPATGLKTVDTEVDGGKIILGEDAPVTSMDVHIANDPSHPQPAGSTAEDDITSNPQDEETLDGQETSTSTIVVTGTMSDGTTVNSTEVLGSKVTADADTQDNTKNTGVDQQLTDGNTTDSLQTTDKTYDEVDTTDKETEALQSTISTTDPTTGLVVTFNVTDQSGDTTADTESGDGLDVSTSTAAEVAPGVAPTPTTTDNKSGEDDVTGDATTFDHEKVTTSLQGSDPQGDQLNLQEKATLDDSATDDTSDDNSQGADGTNSQVIKDHGSGNGQLTDILKGSISTTDPVTGVKTTRTYNDLIVANANDIEDFDADSDSGSGTANWNQQEATTFTNPDGSATNAGTKASNQGSDTETWVDGIETDQGSAATPPSAAAGDPEPTISGMTTAGDTTARGSINGGDAVVITGSGFSGDSQVAFDGVASQSFVVLSSTEIIAVTPSHAAGQVTVTVSNAAGSSSNSPAGTFTFDAADNSDTVNLSDTGSSGSGSSGSLLAESPDDGYFAQAAKSLLRGLGNLAKETVYYVRDVDAAGIELYARVSGFSTLTGIDVRFDDWSAAALNNPTNNPNFWSDAGNQAGRAGAAAGTLGGTEIVAAIVCYVETEDVSGAQERLFSIAGSNLVGAAAIKLTLPRTPAPVGNPLAQALLEAQSVKPGLAGVVELTSGEIRIGIPPSNVQNPTIIIGGSISEVGTIPITIPGAAAVQAGEVLVISAETEMLGASDAVSNGPVFQPRDSRGRFAAKVGGELAPGSLAEPAIWDAIAQKPGWTVIPGRVYVVDSTGQVRVYDGVAVSPGQRNIGLEIKSGTGRLTAEQRTFDARLNSNRANTAIGVGAHRNLVINRAVFLKGQ
jgi:hypothetical protein